MIALEVQSPSPEEGFGIRLIGVSASVSVGQKGLIHITGRNDMPDAQQMGIKWQVTDPDGIKLTPYSEWEKWPYSGAGVEHRFTGGRFPLDKEGTYTLDAELMMNEPDPVTVDRYHGVLCSTTIEAPPEYKLLQDTVYPYAYVYDGDVEVSTVVFRTEPFTPTAWQAERLAQAMKTEVEARGSRVIALKVYADTTPLLWSDFRVELTATPLPEGVSVSVGAIPLVAAIVIAALAIIGVIVALIVLTKTIAKAFKRQALSEEIKLTWSRETLIGVIGDFEEELERTPTPPEDLEKKSDQQLRDYCNELAQVIAPPGIAWWPFAVGGAVALGLGVVIWKSAR